MATMNVSLPERMKSWVEEQAADGRYANTSDYVHYLICNDQEREEAVSRLQSAVTAGLESGYPHPFDAETFKRRMREEYLVD